MTKDARPPRSRSRDPSTILILRSETPQERELFALFHRLAPENQEGLLAQLRETVSRTALKAGAEGVRISSDGPLSPRSTLAGARKR